jgi:hypothetical protein
MADAHVDVQGFDFHAGNLTTACRAEASSEGGMKHGLPRRIPLCGRRQDETQIFRAKHAKKNPVGISSISPALTRRRSGYAGVIHGTTTTLKGLNQSRA